MSSPIAQPAGTEPIPQLTRFRIIRRLGQGGAGVVYEAIDRERGTRVALKTLRGLDGEALLRFKEEFRALQDIQHPNVIRLGELQTDHDTWFFTMELVDGATLLAFVTDETHLTSSVSIPAYRSSEGTTEPAPAPVPERRVLFDEARLRDGLGQLARGLAAIHAAGKVHRDIKPGNVLVALDGRVVILDFGLATDTQSTAHVDDSIVGTIGYMAPEQAAGEPVGPAADWYAVGCVLYRCLTGRLPFKGTTAEVLQAKLTRDPPPPDSIVDDLPPDLASLCVALLARDPELRPDGGGVLERLRQRSPTIPPAAHLYSSAQSLFVGRSREFEQLAETFANMREGRAKAIVLEGESGVGKSALVRRFVRRLPSFCPDVLVLAGRCYEREDVPYKAIDGVLDALSGHFANLRASRVSPLLPDDVWLVCRVFPVLGRVAAIAERAGRPEGFDVQESRDRLFQAIRELLRRLAEVQPLVLFIDDLQWADADSFALLRELQRPPGAPKLLLIATSRAPEVPHEGAPFGLPGDIRLLPLDRLATGDATELASRLLQGASVARSGLADAIAKEAQGHPLFIHELVRHAQLTGGETLVNLSLDDAMYTRVQQLDAAPRALLELLCLAGVALAQDVVRDALDLEHGAFTEQVATLRGAQLARTTGWRGEDAIESFHNRVREAVSARVDEATRSQRHRQLASALERAGAKDAEALYTHWLAAGDTAKAGVYAAKAADAANAAFAFEHAARLYERAVELLPEGARDADLYVTLAEALANAGFGAKSADAFERAAKMAPEGRALALRCRSAEELLTSGALDEGRARLQAVAKAVGLTLPPNALVAALRFLALRAVLWLRGYGFERRTPSPEELLPLETTLRLTGTLGTIEIVSAVYLHTRALLLALRLGDVTKVAICVGNEATTLSTGGARNAPRILRAHVRALALASEANDPIALGTAKSAGGLATFMCGFFPAAKALGDEATDILRRRGAGAFVALRNAQFVSLWALSWMGELHDLDALIDARTREAEQRHDLYALCMLATGQLALGPMRHADPVRVRARAEEMLGRWTQRGYNNQHYWTMIALLRVDLYEGRARDALTRIARQWGAAHRSLMFQTQIVYTEALHLRASASIAMAMAADGDERATHLAWAHRAAKKLAKSEMPFAPAFVGSIRAGIAGVLGDADRAREELELAAAGFQHTSMHLHAATASFELGRLIGGELGRERREGSERWFEAHGIKGQERMRAMLLPGLEKLR